jgi:hypothetical protein
MPKPGPWFFDSDVSVFVEAFFFVFLSSAMFFS